MQAAMASCLQWGPAGQGVLGGPGGGISQHSQGAPGHAGGAGGVTGGPAGCHCGLAGAAGCRAPALLPGSEPCRPPGAPHAALPE